jgi:hypothetical protein
MNRGRKTRMKNNYLIMTTASPDVYIWGVCALPFQVGNECCLEEREVSLVDHIQHKD